MRTAIAMSLAVWMTVLGVVPRSAVGGLIATETVMNPESSEARARVEAILGRADVREQLEALGVDPREAGRRVAALTDLEIIDLDRRLADLPAGSSFAAVVGGILLAMVLVLFVTDLIGYTNVFPFINPLPEPKRSRQ